MVHLAWLSSQSDLEANLFKSEVFLPKAFSSAKGYFSNSTFCLTIFILNVHDDLDNITRFLILAREPIIPGIDKPQKTSIVFTLEEGHRV
uniref:Uncharacterized protein n=1 Tax=Lactuca sativa TaxID=4236 RepID=A0A9R1X4W0_LACSA|nr:hypothetical protein LSAT_V11C700352630 [Lactuca sativa]